jgi:aminopeptidase 2
VERETKTLTFNASGLALSDISLEFDGSSHAHESQASGDGEHRTTLTYATAFPAGASLRLRIAFAGTLSGDGDSKGYYASDAGTCAVTQFHVSARALISDMSCAKRLQPDAAHRVFPCWDEPALKATFALTLVVPAGAVALSTMSVLPSTADTLDGALAQLSIVDPEKWTTTRFVTTPPVRTIPELRTRG